MNIDAKIQHERDFIKYLRLLAKRKNHSIIFIAVGDTGAGPALTEDIVREFMACLGIKVSLLNRYRCAYASIIEKGTVIAEKLSDDLTRPVVIEGSVDEKQFSVFSGGFECVEPPGARAVVHIDGANYAADYRGLNFVVYDFHDKRVIDTSSFDPFDNLTSSKPYVMLPLLENIRRKNNVTIALFKLPETPPRFYKNASDNERFIFQNGLNHDLFFRNLEEIYKGRLSPLCNDVKSLDEFREILTPPKSFIDIDGVRRFENHVSATVNTRDGIRVTTDQPLPPHLHSRAIYLVGFCTTFGVGADDAHTIASYLQRKLNAADVGQTYIVYNYGYFLGSKVSDDGKEISAVLNSLPLKSNDIVLFNLRCNLDGFPCCDLSLKSIRPHDYGEIFYSTAHYTKNGNRMIANGLFDFLKDNAFFGNDSNVDFVDYDEQAVFDTDENKQLADYKNRLRRIYAEKIRPQIGAIVMNCNPFTLGHLYLVKEAKKRCERLIVFVVEEDKSVFPFAERFALVCENLADMKNVFVLPSGQFIISSRTFTEYFNKESLQERQIDTTLDVTIFAKEIVPCLGITVRFAGTEPFDNVTRQYNESMRRVLPQYGIEFVEIPRLKVNGKDISASEVRELLQANQFNKLKKLVPKKTLQYLRKHLPNDADE